MAVVKLCTDGFGCASETFGRVIADRKALVGKPFVGRFYCGAAFGSTSSSW